MRRAGWSGWWQRTADGSLVPDPDGPPPERVDPNGGRPRHRHGSEVATATDETCPTHPATRMTTNGRRRWCRACNRDRAATSAARRRAA